MLSRVANNLYWMGRYMERLEHISRYTKELYFSSLDAPIEDINNRKFVLESILFMCGIFDMEEINERNVLYKIGFDPEYDNSLINIVSKARENARGARNEISTELWETINTFYHFMQSYSVETFLSTGLYDLTEKILDQTSLLRTKIYSTILYDETWSLILCAMHLERSLQMIRILNSKLNDIYKIQQLGYPVTELSFEWTTLLRCTETFDMNRKYYRSIPNKNQVLEFLILNIQNPRSIHYSITRIAEYLSQISQTKKTPPNSIEFTINKLSAQYKFLTIDEYKDDVYPLLNNTRDVLLGLCSDIEKKYLSY